MGDLIDLDPSLDALDALAADFADPGDETSACPSIWPLVAIPDDALSPLDRDARDRHLARCARCRVALAETWLDAGGDDIDADDLVPAAGSASLPAAVALPALPNPRRRATRWLAAASVAAAAAASLVAIVVPLTRSSSAEYRGDERERKQLVDAVGRRVAVPVDLVVLVDSRALDNAPIIEDSIHRLPQHLPPGSSLTVAIASGPRLDVVSRGVVATPARAFSLTPLFAGLFRVPETDFAAVLPQALALGRDPVRPPAILVFGDGCTRAPLRNATALAPALAVVDYHTPAAPCPARIGPRFTMSTAALQSLVPVPATGPTPPDVILIDQPAPPHDR